MDAHNEDMIKFSRIFRCVRKYLGLSQQTLSDMLSTSQSVLSKIESMTSMPSASLIFRLCEITGIPVESFRSGYVDQPVESFCGMEKLRGGDASFKVPHKYIDHSYSTIRSLQPFLRYYEQFESKGWEEYCLNKRIDPDYFICWNNQLNARHSVEMIKDMLLSNPDPGVIIEFLALQACEPKNHGYLAKNYLESNNAFDLLQLYINNMKSYDSNFLYQVEDMSSGKLELSVEEREHVAPLLKYDRDLFLDFSHHYNIKYLGYLSRMLSNDYINVAASEGKVGDRTRWHYKIEAITAA